MEEQSYRMGTINATDTDVGITGNQSMTNSLYQTKQLEDAKKGYCYVVLRYMNTGTGSIK